MASAHQIFWIAWSAVTQPIFVPRERIRSAMPRRGLSDVTSVLFYCRATPANSLSHFLRPSQSIFVPSTQLVLLLSESVARKSLHVTLL